MRHTTTTPRLAYDTAGERGPRVLLVMGYCMRGAIWKPQIDGLSGSHRLAWYDHRAIGESDAAPGPWSMAELAGDAVRVLDALGWERAHVVGVSMGGMIAQEVALAAPARVASLALIATQPGGPRAWLPTGRGLAAMALGAALAPVDRRATLRGLLYTPAYVRRGPRAPIDASIDERLACMPAGPVKRAFLGAVRRHDTRDRLARIAAPTVVLRPDADVLIDPRHSDELARRIPGARLVRIDDAGHGLILEAADRVNTALADHIAAAEA